MGQVVRLPERSPKRSVTRPVAPRLLGERTYFCMGCDTDRFTLYPGGRVQCANCGALMENLRVADETGSG